MAQSSVIEVPSSGPFLEPFFAPLPLGPSVAERRALVERIIATPPFAKSERLISFLRHICQMESVGLAGEINEQRIGQSVFGRPKDYDPSIDGIVRAHATRLRNRLDQYFETHGIDEPFRLSIPRGGYVPLYEPRHMPSRPLPTELPLAGPSHRQSASTVQPQDKNGRSRHKSSRRWWLLAALVSLAFMGGLLLNNSMSSHLRMLVGEDSPSDQLWNSVFIRNRDTTLVVGDGGVNMFQNMARRQLSAEEYSSRSWLSDPYAKTPPGYSWAPIASRSYTPWFVIGFATRLARLPQVHDRQLKSISARSLTLDALKNDQLILIGGPEYNPWEQLLWKDRNFHIVYDGVENSISIINKLPQPGEAPIYKWSQTDTTTHAGYSLVSLGNNLNGNGRILVLGGSTAQADDAAAEFILDRVKIEPFLQKAINTNGQLANFEMVVQTNFVAGGNTDSHIVAYRIYR